MVNSKQSLRAKALLEKGTAKRMLNPLLMVGAALLFPACDALVDYRFLLTNNTSKELQVHIKTPQIDTLVTIPVSGQSLLLEKSQVNSGVKPFFEAQDTIWWFSELSCITLPDSHSVTKEMRIAGNWTFSKGSDKKGVYALALVDADF